MFNSKHKKQWSHGVPCVAPLIFIQTNKSTRKEGININSWKRHYWRKLCLCNCDDNNTGFPTGFSPSVYAWLGWPWRPLPKLPARRCPGIFVPRHAGNPRKRSLLHSRPFIGWTPRGWRWSRARSQAAVYIARARRSRLSPEFAWLRSRFDAENLLKRTCRRNEA